MQNSPKIWLKSIVQISKLNFKAIEFVTLFTSATAPSTRNEGPNIIETNPTEETAAPPHTHTHSSGRSLSPAVLGCQEGETKRISL